MLTIKWIPSAIQPICPCDPKWVYCTFKGLVTKKEVNWWLRHLSNSLYTIPNCISDALILEFCETVLVKWMLQSNKHTSFLNNQTETLQRRNIYKLEIQVNRSMWMTKIENLITQKRNRKFHRRIGERERERAT